MSLYDNNLFGFYAVSANQAICTHHIGLWVLVMAIFHHFRLINRLMNKVLADKSTWK